MKKSFLLFIISSLVSTGIYPQNNFEINFGTPNQDVGYSIQQTIEGKYIVAGSTSSAGNINSDVYISLVDTNGSLLWTKSIGGNLDDLGSSIIQTDDSGYVIAGSTSSFGNGMSDVYLIKTNVNGDTLWTKTFGGIDFDYGNSIEKTIDDGFIIAGQESSTNGGIANIYLVKTNSAGDSSWTKSYPMGAWAGASSVLQNADSGYLVYGDYENNISGVGDYDLVFMKTDSLGNLQWTKTIEDSLFHDYAQCIRQTNDGGYILASQREDLLSLLYASSKIIRLDSNADTIWTKVFGINYNYSISDLYQSADSGFVITGYSYDNNLSANVLFITKLNSQGDSLWTKIYDGLFSAGGNSIQQTTDGGMVICGFTIDAALTESNVYVLKTDSNGYVFSCQPFISNQPHSSSIFENSNTAFSISSSVPISSYQWQTDSLGQFVNLHDDTIYSGTNADSLHLTNVPLSMNGYSFRCIIVDSAGCSDTSQVVILFVSTSVGIHEVYGNQFSVYPNPVSNNIFISGSIPESSVLSDAFGKIISVYQSENSIDVSSLSRGVYFLKVFSRSKRDVEVFRIIRN